MRGSGAGMEPPADSTFRDGVWHYDPHLAPLDELRLTHSIYTSGYELCRHDRCEPLTDVRAARRQWRRDRVAAVRAMNSGRLRAAGDS